MAERKDMLNREKKRAIISFLMSINHGISDENFLKLKYRLIFGERLDLDNPKTFNEKLQWLKLYDRKDIYTVMVDKYEAKKYVAGIIGEEYIIPTLGIYDKYEDINFDKLPKKFVMKCTHNSGGIVICKDKTKIDNREAKKILNKCLRRNFYYANREWPYKNVKPRIIIEKYMEDKKDGELRDYKLFCFNGKFQMMFIATNRYGAGETCFDFFDKDFKHLPFTNGHPNAPVLPHKPTKLKEMIRLAEKLSKGIPQVRVDFYEANGKIYFGEMTFFHWSGLVPFEPEEWDLKFGEMINLDEVRGNRGTNAK